MIRSKRILATIAMALFALPALSASGAAAPSSPGMRPWKEKSAGLLVSRPENRIEAKETEISGEVVLSPGSGFSLERGSAWDAATAEIGLKFRSDGCNTTSKDYREGDASFPVSVTLIFGDDFQDIAWRKRAMRFIGRLWTGNPPGGIRLTYAWGCRAPVGSMYRISEEETVFVVAGADEAGKTVESTRRPLEDFRAAYARDPKGGITGAVVRFGRPSSEKGKVNVTFGVTLPK